MLHLDPRRHHGTADQTGNNRSGRPWRGSPAAPAIGLAHDRPRAADPGTLSPWRPVPPTIARPEYVGQEAPERWRGSHVQTPETIEKMRIAGRLAAQATQLAGEHCKPGVTTDEIDRVVHEFLCDHGAYPSTLGYKGFPKSCCTSLNEVICHGIPDSTVLEDGDIINVDVTAYIDGVHGDTDADLLRRRGQRGGPAAGRAHPRGDDARHPGGRARAARST